MKKRDKTVGCVEAASGVVPERINAVSRVVAASCVAEERTLTDGGIVRAGCQGEKRNVTFGGIATGIASVGCRDNPESSRGRRKCKRTKRKRDDNGKRTGNGEW